MTIATQVARGAIPAQGTPPAAPVAPATSPSGTPAPAGTSAKLFPHLDKASGLPISVPPPVENPVAPPVVAPPVVTPPAKKSVTLELDDEGRIANFDAIGELKIQIKVDGKESVETLHGLRRGYQLDSHLNQKGQRIGEQLAALKSLEQDLVQRTATAKSDPKIESDDPAIQELLRQQRDLKTTITALEARVSAAPSGSSGATPDQTREQNILAIRRGVEARGHQDFDKYFSRLESYVLGLPPEQQKRFMHVDAWVAEFSEVKLKDLSVRSPIPASPGGPPVGANVTIVEPGGGGGSTTPSSSEAWQRRYDVQRNIAVELSKDPVRSTQATQAWVELDQIIKERPAAS